MRAAGVIQSSDGTILECLSDMVAEHGWPEMDVVTTVFPDGWKSHRKNVFGEGRQCGIVSGCVEQCSGSCLFLQ